MNVTATQYMGFQTKDYLVATREAGSPFKNQVIGRIKLLATALVGTVEVIVRLSLFLLGHIAGLFTFYRSPSIKEFLTEQTEGGFSACVITSASFFSLLSPILFESVHFPQEAVLIARSAEEELEPEEGAQIERIIHPRMTDEERRIAGLVMGVVSLPFQMIAFCFKLPFYITYLTFQMALLPLRLALLPFQIFIHALTFDPRDTFRLNLL